MPEPVSRQASVSCGSDVVTTGGVPEGSSSSKEGDSVSEPMQ